MKKIDVSIPGKNYPFLFIDELALEIPHILAKYGLNKNIFAVIDRNVFSLYGGEINKLLTNLSGKSSKLIINSNEKVKSLDTVQKIYSALLKKEYVRDTVILAIGGGIIGDIAGFAAASFTRGVKYVQLPTTLLAAVDSSVGGKTGVNFGDTKNIIGAFHQPELVAFSSAFLRSLSEKEMLCGIGEIVKYAFLAGKTYYNYVDKNLEKIFELDNKALRKIITDSVKYKAAVVSKDEKESGIRKVLNLGHTFAHAFEVEQSHKIKHGEAVIVGIVCSLFLSFKLGIIDPAQLKKHLSFFNRFLGRIRIKTPDLNKIYTIMLRDKKNKDGVIKFVLIKSPGEILLDVEANKKDVYFALSNGLQFFK